jgi:hypothetical protein
LLLSLRVQQGPVPKLPYVANGKKEIALVAGGERPLTLPAIGFMPVPWALLAATGLLPLSLFP